MVVKHWSLPTLSELFYRHDGYPTSTQHQSKNKTNQALAKAENEWLAAIAAMEELLLSLTTPPTGILLSSSVPLLSDQNLFSRLLVGVFTTEAFDQLTLSSPVLEAADHPDLTVHYNNILQLPLLPKDPLINERYALLFTPEFSLAIILGKDNLGLPKLHFSFNPELMQGIWETLKTRLFLTNHKYLSLLETSIAQITPVEPSYRLVTQFSRSLLKNVTSVSDLELIKKVPNKEIELLQALTHEIRTPLTTIRTLTRLLLKRSSQFNPDVLNRLEMIDQECTEQINRMDLIFKVTELESKALEYPIQLFPISLEKLFQENIPRWQKQSQRRNVVLKVILPQKLPTVLGDPTMLEQILTNLMEKITKNLVNGGEICVQVTTLGSQLKLELLSTSTFSNNHLKSLGQLLMFQPETGSLSLNLDVTKNLFNLMGGKLTVRKYAREGEVLTIFLPIKTPCTIQASQEV